MRLSILPIDLGTVLCLKLKKVARIIALKMIRLFAFLALVFIMPENPDFKQNAVWNGASAATVLRRVI